MARKRIIDTEKLYFDTEIVELLGDRGIHLYIRLWGISEDWGGYEPKYSDIALKMGALLFKKDEVEKYIKKLIEANKIFQYEFNGRYYHWIVNFLNHQALTNPSPPQLPLPKWINCEIKKYPSGKVYAAYSVANENLPVAYHKPTSSLTVIEKRNETKRNGNETVTSIKRVCGTPAPAPIQKAQNQKQKYLEFVFLSEEENKKLKELVGDKCCDIYIEKLNNHIGSEGKIYQSHYHTILKWLDEDGKKNAGSRIAEKKLNDEEKKKIENEKELKLIDKEWEKLPEERRIELMREIELKVPETVIGGRSMLIMGHRNQWIRENILSKQTGREAVA